MKSFYFHDDNLLFLLSSAHWKVHSILNKKLTKSGFPVTPDQWLIMLNLHNEGPMYQGELAKAQLKDKAAVKRLLDHLEKEKLLTRVNSKKDLRKKQVKLTPEGKKMVVKLNEVSRRTIKKACKGLSEVELNALKRLVQMIEKSE